MKKITFKFFLSVIAMLVMSFSLTAQCDYTLELQDSWGDGWNGGSLDVDINGTITNYGFLGTDGSPAGDVYNIPIAVNDGDAVTVSVNTPGSYPTEAQWDIRDASGTIIFTDGDAAACCSADNSLSPIGGSHTFTVTCPTCGPASTLASANETETTADVTWTTGAGCVTNQTVTVDPAIAGSPFSVACGTGTLALTGLTENTAYTVTVANDCAGTPSSSITVTTTPAPAVNDVCATAIPITPSAAGTGCATAQFTLPFTADGTTDSGVPTVCSDPGLDQWFTWTATVDGLTFSSQNPGSPGIAVYASCADATAGTSIACTATFANESISGWNIGDDLLIQIYDFANSTSDVAFCLEEACTAATAGAASAVTNASADITWTAGSGCVSTQTVTVTPAVAGSPFALACGTETLSLTGLTAETAYTVNIANDCGALPSADVTFTTAAACDAPSDVTASNVTFTSADIAWLAGPGCIAVNTVTIVPAVAGAPTTAPCAGPLALTGLTAGTSYTVTIANDCGAFPSTSFTFSTLTPGANCSTAVVLPNLDGGGTHSETATTIAPDTDGAVGFNAGTGDAAWFSFTPTADGTIDVSSCLGGADTEVYIHDNCAGPSIAFGGDVCAFAADGTGSTWAAEVVGVPVTGGVTYYIEWNDRYSEGPADWSITFSLPAVPCVGAPTNIVTEATAATSVYMSWDMVPGTALYQVKYRERGTAVWSKFATAFTQRNITGLDGNKQYQYKVRRQCDGGEWSDYSAISMFPLFYSSTCDGPTGVSTVYLNNTSFKVRWDAALEVRGKIRYREVGTIPWLTKNSQLEINYIYITGLVADADYEYRVRLNCNDNEWSAYNTLYFHSLAAVAPRNAQELTGVRLYPNPASDVLNIAYDNELGTEVTVEVFDILGRAIISEISNDNQIVLNINQLAKGSYVVSIVTDGKQSIQKFVKK